MSVSLTNPPDNAVCEVLEVWGPFKYWVKYALNDGSGDFSKCGVHSNYDLKVGDKFVVNHLLVFEIIANDITIISRANSSSTEANAAADCNAVSPGTDAEATAQQREHPASESSGA